jgi:hypothetical protein
LAQWRQDLIVTGGGGDGDGEAPVKHIGVEGGLLHQPNNAANPLVEAVVAINEVVVETGAILGMIRGGAVAGVQMGVKEEGTRTAGVVWYVARAAASSAEHTRRCFLRSTRWQRVPQ